MTNSAARVQATQDRLRDLRRDRRRGALHGRIAPLAPSMRFAGPALTVEVRPGDNLMIHAALAIAKRIPLAGDGAVEVRPVIDED